MNSLFLTFEGPDGCGKSTQARLLAEKLRSQGYDVFLTREPGGTSLGEAVRELLLGKEYELTSSAEALLYAAARAQHVEEKIRPALAKGQIVICDRFVDSSLAYQGYGLGLSLQRLREINLFATSGLEPDLTILLDLDPQIGLARARAGRGQTDRIEERDGAFHKQVREGFLDLARSQPERFAVIQVEGLPPEEVEQLVWTRVEKLLGKQRGTFSCNKMGVKS